MSEMKVNTDSNTKMTQAEITKFTILSIIGLFLFIIPIPYKGDFSILVGMMADVTKKAIGPVLPGFMTVIIVLSAVLSLIGTLAKPSFIMDSKFMKSTFVTTPLWLVFRVLGGIFAVLTFFKLGGEIVYSDATGGTMLWVLMPTLATWFFFSCILLPFLMESGVMDYTGTMIRKIMRPLFLVPGRSAIDAVASWIGSGPVGVVITNRQYMSGFYTAKEASIISVCFSLVSLPFAVVVADFLKLSHLFLPFYGTICVTSFIAALILPRIYPLRGKSEEYHPATGKRISEDVPEGKTISQWALEKGVARSKEMPGPYHLLVEGLKTVLDVYMGLMPLVMAWGTLALILTEHTPVFTWLSYPFVVILNAMGVEGATTAAPAVVMGFADMFLPSIIVANLEFEATRFIIGALSFTQLIYMTETGAVILRSEIPLKFRDLFVIFLERTLITLPIIVIIAKMIF